MKLVTLIIPTYNRPDFLKRLLTYYNHYAVKFKIIIADSSTPGNKKLNKEVILSFPKLDILHLDHFSPKLVAHYKFAKMVEFVKTKYVCFCADDDFIVPNGINKAIEFLEKNPDYSAAHGTYIAFYISRSLSGSKQLLWKFIYPFKSLISPKPEDRVVAHLLKYEQVLYAVRRTDIVKTCYREFVKSKASPIFFGELLPDMLTVIYGKMKRVNTLYAARQSFSTSCFFPTLMDAGSSGVYNQEYIKYSNCLLTNLIKKSDISKQKAKELIDTSAKYFYYSTWQQYVIGRIDAILRYLPKFVATGIRTLHVRYLFLKDQRETIGKIDHPTSKYFKDFNTIRRIALQKDPL